MTRHAKVLFSMLAFFAALFAKAQDVLTWHNDNARTGLYASEKFLTKKNVNPTTFGKLFVIPVDGKVDAEPLYVQRMEMPGPGLRNVLYVATEHDSVYAFDADTGQEFWHVGLQKPGESPSDDRNCSQIAPEIGITATPAIDRQAGSHGRIYVIAMSKDDAGHYFQRLHALELETGKEELGGPVAIGATYPGTGWPAVTASRSLTRSSMPSGRRYGHHIAISVLTTVGLSLTMSER